MVENGRMVGGLLGGLVLVVSTVRGVSGGDTIWVSKAETAPLLLPLYRLIVVVVILLLFANLTTWPKFVKTGKFLRGFLL